MALVVLLLAHGLQGRAGDGIQASLHVKLLCTRERCKREAGEVEDDGPCSGLLPADSQVLVQLHLEPNPEIWEELSCGSAPCDLELCNSPARIVAAVRQEVGIFQALEQSRGRQRRILELKDGVAL